ncbi:aquaporin-like protein [Phyllosticta citrichinensis]|uniref:Aquaporin-like protein n=1 Tax=Phyllosticta citrichinensis TaxID=1130410 RepID=A0ABR1XLB1_9PEZI
MTSASKASKWSDRPDMGDRTSTAASFNPKIEDDYYKVNPWYGAGPDKPIFGLGKPLPRKVRWKSNADRIQEEDAKEADLEKGNSRPQTQERPRSSARSTASRDARPDSQHQPQSQPDLSKEQSRPKSGGSDSIERPKPGRRVTFGTPNSTQQAPEKQEQPGNRPQTAETIPEERESPEDKDRSSKKQSHSDNMQTYDPSLGQAENDNAEWAIDAEPIGQREADAAVEGNADPNELRNWWAKLRAKHPEPMAEFLCTTVSIFFGVCATLQVNLSNGQYGTYETSCWAWGLAFTFGIYLGGGVSGAHMNPAISLALWIFRGFPFKQMCIYIGVQTLGSVVAGALAYAIYHDLIHSVDPGLVTSASSFYSSPQDYLSMQSAFFTQFLASAVMMMCILSLGDDQNNPPGAGLHAFIVGLVITVQKMTLGYNTGAALNPVSDFGPRLVCVMVGYKLPMFTEWGAWWLWGPWIATCLGALAGCSVYDGLIFVGSESPINYRLPEKYRRRIRAVVPTKH